MKDPEREQDNLSGNIWEVRNIDRDKELEKLKSKNGYCSNSCIPDTQGTVIPLYSTQRGGE